MNNTERLAVNAANGYILIHEGDGYEVYKKQNEVGGWSYYSDRMGGHEGHFKILDDVIISKEEYIAVGRDAFGLGIKEGKSALEMVEEFHNAYDCPVYVIPSLPSYNGAYSETIESMFNVVSKYFDTFFIHDSRTLLRMKLIFEEYKELCEAMRSGNFVEILDALCDLLYVVYGTAHEFGLGPVLKQAFTEVHRSNMSKLGEDGKPIYREDGKVLKGPNFTPPDLASIIEAELNKNNAHG